MDVETNVIAPLPLSLSQRAATFLCYLLQRFYSHPISVKSSAIIIHNINLQREAETIHSTNEGPLIN